MKESLKVVVDKAAFLEMGRVFKRVYRSASKNVILTLGNGRLRIEFFGGGCELPCDSQKGLVAEVTAKSFAGIIAAYHSEKYPTGTITLTFRPEFGEFATPLAGAKAKFHH
jgi:hypothetical protein